MHHPVISPPRGYGRAVVSADPGPDEAAALAVQADGTIVVAAHAGGPAGDPPDSLVALTPGGILDTSFANAGKPQVQVGFGSIALARDDKIAAVGHDALNGWDAQALELRNADGTSDTTFAGGSPVLNRPSTISNGYARQVAVAPDGKLVVGALDGDPALKSNLLAITRYQVDSDPAGSPTGANTPPATPVAAQPPDPLALSNLTITHRAFSVGRTSTRALGHAQTARLTSRGTAFIFKLNRAATVTIRIKRLHAAGTVIRLKRSSNTGRNRVAFSGRVARHALRTGRYRATLTATDVIGTRSNAKAITFRIVRH